MKHANGNTSRGGYANAPAFGGDRLPPQNLEAEQSVLGSCLIDGSAIDDVIASGLMDDDFFRAAYGQAWLEIAEMRRAGDEVDPVTFAAHLERKGLFGKLGGNEMIRQLVESVPHAANAVYYAGIVREKAAGRRLIEACTAIIGRCYSGEYTAPDLVCEAQEVILALGDRDAGEDTTSYAVLVEETMARMALRDRGEMLGIPSGFPDLDVMTGGFRRSELTILAARPGMGKTSLALDMAENVAAEGQIVLFFSVEMGRESLGDRIVTNDAGVNNELFQRPWTLKDPDKQRIYQSAARLRSLPIEIDFQPSRTTAQIGAVARRLQRRRGLGLLVVDYLQLVKGVRDKNDSREQEVARISRDLKALSRSLAIPVLALAQLNRNLEGRGNKAPILSDLRESGSLEQDADIVMMLHRPEYYDAEDKPGQAELYVAKNRNGRTGVVPLTFVAESTRFESFAHEGVSF
jgi:replicative DNA helicase